MKILLLEYFCSRAKDKKQKENFYNEGIKILASAVSSFLKNPEIRVKGIIHSSFRNHFLAELNSVSELNIKGDLNSEYDNNSNFELNSKLDNLDLIINNRTLENIKNYYEYLSNIDLSDCEAFLITAPEKDNILAEITKIMEEKGLRNLGSSSKTVKKAANKWLLHKNLSDNFSSTKEIKTPQSKLLTTQKMKNLLSKNNSADRNRFFSKFIPAVIKENYSAGSELEIVRNENELKYFLKNNLNTAAEKNYLIQKIIDGIPGSISAAADEDNVLILSINKQYINKNNFHYEGGEINYPFKNAEILEEVAAKIKVIYPGLNGYFGVDFVYHDGKFYILEINPRLTSSIIGICQLFNFSEYIISAEHNALKKMDQPIENNNWRLKFLLE